MIQIDKSCINTSYFINTEKTANKNDSRMSLCETISFDGGLTWNAPETINYDCKSHLSEPENILHNNLNLDMPFIIYSILFIAMKYKNNSI